MNTTLKQIIAPTKTSLNYPHHVLSTGNTPAIQSYIILQQQRYPLQGYKLADHDHIQYIPVY